MRKANWAIEKVTGDMVGRFAFNTAIAAIMELINEIYRHPQADREARRFATATAASLLFPFAPHLGSEVYERLTGQRVWETPWPEADPEMLRRPRRLPHPLAGQPLVHLGAQMGREREQERGRGCGREPPGLRSACGWR